MMINHPFGIAGGARGVVESYGIPLIIWHQPVEVRVTGRKHCLIIITEQLTLLGEYWVQIIYNQRLNRYQFECKLNCLAKR